MQVVIEHAGVERELRLEVDDPDACVSDLVVTVDPAAGALDAGVVLDGRFFGPDTGLDELPLADGAVLTIVERPPTPAPPHDGPRLAVVGGPVAGTEHPLLAEACTVGRDPSTAVAIDDPTVSGTHAQISFEFDRTLTVADRGSRNGTWLDGELVRGTTPLAEGSLLRLGASQLRVRCDHPDDRPAGADPAPGGGGRPVPFNRPPRAALPEPPAPLQAPPPRVERTASRTLSAVAFVGPLVIGGVLIWMYQDARFALFMLLSPIMLVGNWLSERKRAKKENKTSAREFREALAQLERDLDTATDAERRRRDRLLPDPVEILRRATQPSTRLWERRPAHADVLRLRVGLGDVPWQPPVETGSDDVAEEVRDLLTRHAKLARSPVDVDLSEGGVVGLVGDRRMVVAIARSLVCQAGVHHGPADLALTVLAKEATAGDWDWSKWLPHARHPDGANRMLAGDRAASEALLGAIFEAAEPDDQRSRFGSQRERPAGPVRLVVVDDLTLLEGRRAPARRLLAGVAGPVAGIVLADSADQLPAVCDTVVTLTSDLGDAQLARPQAGWQVDELVVCGMAETTARHCARALARFEDPELAIAGAGLPRLARLLPLLGMDDIDAGQVATSWRQRLPDPGAPAPVGVGEDGAVHLDLRDDGPHGLIGGTTGSGKSELLRSVVAGMAANADPDHLVFVLVDYKGGSAFDECARLPHVVGMVTDLDEHLGERALRSLEAELGHRERVLREAGTQDLPAYLAAGAPHGPLPRLVVVVDEFATLATELPDFLGALVGVAQRGRSLGVHMILATQRPSGAVNANIKANTNLRIALRVQDAADSMDIIDRDDAALLSRSTPGRAYVRLGPSDVTLVQTPLSTAVQSRGQTAGVRLTPFRFGPGEAAPSPSSDGDGRPSDLHRLVGAVHEAFDASGMHPPREPWLPMLGEHIALGDVLADRGDLDVPLGVADEPDRQRQVRIGWQLAEGHLALFGMVGSGTTTALLTVARSLVERFDPGHCHLYAIDFGAGHLAALADLPHVGAVVAASQREAQFRLVRHLKAELDRRRDLGPSQLADQPWVVVLVDGVGAFLAEHEGVDSVEVADTFRRVFSEGPTARILFAVAADRVGALPIRLSSLVSQKLLLRLADAGDYNTIGVRPKQLPRFVPGRAIEAADQRVVQLATPDGDWLEIAAACEDRHPGLRAPQIRTLPRELTIDELDEPGPPGPLLRLPLGVADDDLATAFLDLHAGEHAVVLGPPRSGKTTTLRLLAEGARRADPETIVVAVCSVRSPLYGHQMLDASGTVDDLGDVLAAAPTDERRWLVLVDDLSRVDDPDEVLAGLTAAGRDGLHVVGAARGDEVRSDFGRWYRPLRRSRTGLLLQPELPGDGDLLGVRLPRRVHVPLVAGRGFLVGGGTAALVQVATPSTADQLAPH